MAKRKTSPYRGELNSPLTLKLPPKNKILAAMLRNSKPELEKLDQQRVAAGERVKKQIPHRLVLLAKHYGLQWPRDAAELVLALARAHVPGFRIVDAPPKRGRKLFWTFERRVALLDAVDRVKRRHKRLSDLAACRILATNKEFTEAWAAPPDDHKRTKEAWIRTLRSRLQDARTYHRQLIELASGPQPK